MRQRANQSPFASRQVVGRGGDALVPRPSRQRPARGNIAAVGVVSDALGIDWQIPDADTAPPLEPLPVDEEPWFGGIAVIDVTYPRSDHVEPAPFVFWSTANEVLHFRALLERADSDEAAWSLIYAMEAPLVGAPRRPRRAFVLDRTMGALLKQHADRIAPAIASLVELRFAEDVSRPSAVDRMIADAEKRLRARAN